MTRIERIRTAAAIAPAFRGTGRVARSLDLIQGRAAGTLEFNSNVWKAAKPQLKLESGGKCAYCESPTDTVAHGDVEHYRPKSKYWWLAYCYDNYLYACQICNQVYKGDEFPVYATAGMWTGPVLPTPHTPAALAAFAESLIPDPLDPNAGHALADFLVAGREGKSGPRQSLLHRSGSAVQVGGGRRPEGGEGRRGVEPRRCEARVRRRGSVCTASTAKS